MGVKLGTFIRVHILRRRYWLTVPLDDDTIHTVPMRDLIVHQPTDDCICGPATEAYKCDCGCGTITWLINHHSLDGRELTEPDYTGPFPKAEQGD